MYQYTYKYLWWRVCVEKQPECNCGSIKRYNPRGAAEWVVSFDTATVARGLYIDSYPLPKVFMKFTNR